MILPLPALSRTATAFEQRPHHYNTMGHSVKTINEKMEVFLCGDGKLQVIAKSDVMYVSKSH